MTARALFALALLAACVPEHEQLFDYPADAGTAEQALTGNVGADANPLTFWWYAGNPAELRPALECALERIRDATCLPVDVSLDSTRIALKTPMGPRTNCRVLMHEIAEHVLRRRNDHGGELPYVMTQQMLDSICAVQDCPCMRPESEPNPVESTQAPCLDPFEK
jgi:hypothetical protein